MAPQPLPRYLWRGTGGHSRGNPMIDYVAIGNKILAAHEAELPGDPLIMIALSQTEHIVIYDGQLYNIYDGQWMAMAIFRLYNSDRWTESRFSWEMMREMPGPCVELQVRNARKSIAEQS